MIAASGVEDGDEDEDEYEDGGGRGRSVPGGRRALGAGAVELVVVAAQREAVLGRDLILQPLDLLAHELDDPATALADQVIVVRPPERDLVQRLLVVVEATRVRCEIGRASCRERV